MTREAELELEIARLREALHKKDEFIISGELSNALAIHQQCDATTALQELINEVERRTIERCASFIEQGTGDWLLGKKQATAIRALPTGNLKLEDL